MTKPDDLVEAVLFLYFVLPYTLRLSPFHDDVYNSDDPIQPGEYLSDFYVKRTISSVVPDVLLPSND